MSQQKKEHQWNKNTKEKKDRVFLPEKVFGSREGLNFKEAAPQ